MKKLLILVCFMSNLLIGQTNLKKEITISFNIYLDNKKVETDSVLVGYYSKQVTNKYLIINDSFTTYLKPNTIYSMVITHPSYNKQIIRINTDSLKSKINYIDVYLASNKSDKENNKLHYNNTLNKYIVYE